MGAEMSVDLDHPPRATVYCVVPAELSEKLHEPLRRHFAGDESVVVVIETRAGERRRRADRRKSDEGAPGQERRVVRARAGRRVADRRATTLEVEFARELPRRVRPHADRLVFVERLEPSTEQLEDADSARVVARFQAGDTGAFADLYLRYFDRVYRYVLVALGATHDAEDVTQQVFTKVFEALPRYERRAQPFRAWLFTIVRNDTVSRLRATSRTEATDPADLGDWREGDVDEDLELQSLRWVSDGELLMLIERLPLAQQQVLMLRFMLDLNHEQVAEIMGRKPVQVRKLQQRGIEFLRVRLTALGRAASDNRRTPCQRPVRRVRVLRARRYALLR